MRWLREALRMTIGPLDPNETEEQHIEAVCAIVGISRSQYKSHSWKPDGRGGWLVDVKARMACSYSYPWLAAQVIP